MPRVCSTPQVRPERLEGYRERFPREDGALIEVFHLE
jgi:hypothetical protein